MIKNENDEENKNNKNRGENNLLRLLNSMTASDLKKIIKDYNSECIKQGRKDEIWKGFSNLNKDSLVKFIWNGLSEKEKEKYYHKYRKTFINGLITKSIDLIGSKSKREKIKEIKINFDEKKLKGTIQLKIEGFQWETETLLEKRENEFIEKCSCAIGKQNGVCLHLMACYLILYAQNYIELEQIPFGVEQKWIGELNKVINILWLSTSRNLEATIILEGNYKYFIDTTNKIVLTKWEGEYTGEKNYSFDSLKDLNEWLAEHVAKKLIGAIKVKIKKGKIRKIIKDNYGVLSLIFKNKRLVNLILNKVKIIGLPEDSEKIYNYLRDEMEEDTNPPYEELQRSK
ncbi:MAG: hypothetical protein ACTSRZ_19835 [Promethearchaeota archaeon]